MAPRPPSPAPGSERRPQAHDFDEIYASATPPWDIGRPQPAFERLARAEGLVGRVLDVGCGTGEHTLLACSLGHDATGMDLSARAIDLARTKAADRGLAPRYLVYDALRLAELGEQFDSVLDCGLFHVFADDDRERYVANLTAIVPSGGRYHMLCFGDHQPGDWGPRRVSQGEIQTSFAEGWTIDSIEPAIIDITFDPAGVQAWQVAATRL